jgi:hypothetical protein
MPACPRTNLGPILGAILAGVSAFALAAAAPSAAYADGKLTANYTITVARVPVGKINWTVDVGPETFTTRGQGEASGVASWAVSGKGTVSASGSVDDGRLRTTNFAADITRGDEKSDMTMMLDHGNVTEIKAETLAPGDDRVTVTAEHRRDITDPLTAWLIPARRDEALTRQACERTLPIFDGQRRYDLKLTFKRMDKVKTDKGYHGPVVVCAIAFQPVAGHRASSTLVKFLSQGRDIEVSLAPVAGTQLLAPIRLSVAHMLGNLVVQATEFRAEAKPAPRASLGGSPAAE